MRGKVTLRKNNMISHEQICLHEKKPTGNGNRRQIFATIKIFVLLPHCKKGKMCSSLTENGFPIVIRRLFLLIPTVFYPHKIGRNPCRQEGRDFSRQGMGKKTGKIPAYGKKNPSVGIRKWQEKSGMAEKLLFSLYKGKFFFVLYSIHSLIIWCAVILRLIKHYFLFH